MPETFRCKECVLPSTTPGIRFDGNGVCNYCRTYRPMQVLGEEKLLEALSRHRGGPGKYDCLVGVSGGRDSTYALWKLVRDYKLRVLALNYRNPFTSEQARANMNRTLRALDVDLVTFELPGDVHRKDTKKALRVWSHHPSSSMIPIVCSHCKCYWPITFKIARDKGVHLVMIGSNPLETASFKQAGLGGARTYHKLSAIPRLAARCAKELFANPYYLTCSWGPIIKSYLMASHSAPYLRRRFKDMTVLRLFDYIKWNENEVISTITRHLGWKPSVEVASPWRFDCRLDYVRRVMYSSTIGVSELEDLFSKMIREHQMTREEALQRLKTENVIPEEVANKVLDELGFTLSDLGLSASRGGLDARPAA